MNTTKAGPLTIMDGSTLAELVPSQIWTLRKKFHVPHRATLTINTPLLTQAVL